MHQPDDKSRAHLYAADGLSQLVPQAYQLGGIQIIHMLPAELTFVWQMDYPNLFPQHCGLAVCMSSRGTRAELTAVYQIGIPEGFLQHHGLLFLLYPDGRFASRASPTLLTVSRRCVLDG